MNQNEEEMDAENEIQDTGSIFGVMNPDTDIFTPWSWDELDFIDEEDEGGIRLFGENECVYYLLTRQVTAVPEPDTGSTVSLNYGIAEIAPELRVASWVQQEFGNLAEVPTVLDNDQTLSSSSTALCNAGEKQDINPEPDFPGSLIKEAKCSRKTSTKSKNRQQKVLASSKSREIKCPKKALVKSKDRNLQFECTICKIGFSRVTYLHRHQKYIHCTAAEKEALLQQCKSCPAKVRDLLQHVTSCHPLAIKQDKEPQSIIKKQRSRQTRECTVCKVGFSRLNHLHRHQKYVHGTVAEKEVLHEQCPICNLRFSNPGNLSRHQNQKFSHCTPVEKEPCTTAMWNLSGQGSIYSEAYEASLTQ